MMKNRSYRSTNLSRSSTQLSGKEPQASFSEKLKQAAGGREKADLYKEEIERHLLLKRQNPDMHRKIARL